MRAIGWATGTGAALYGLASLAYPDHLGTVGTLWAILTLLWAVRWPLSRSTRPAGPRDPGTRVGSGRGEALPFRRVERWMVGVAMGFMAFVLEKAVLRSVRRGPPSRVPSSSRRPGRSRERCRGAAGWVSRGVRVLRLRMS